MNLCISVIKKVLYSLVLGFRVRASSAAKNTAVDHWTKADMFTVLIPSGHVLLKSSGLFLCRLNVPMKKAVGLS